MPESVSKFGLGPAFLRIKTTTYSSLSGRRVCFNSESANRLKELWQLPLKEIRPRKRPDCSQSSSEFVGQGTNDRALRQRRADEFARHREDEIRLQKWVRWIVEVGERKAVVRHRSLLVVEVKRRPLHSVAGKVHPFKEMSHFIATDAEDDPQNFKTGRLLAQSGVKAGASLLDRSKVKRCGIRNGLDVIFAFEIGVRPWNRRTIGDSEGLGKCRANIRIGGAAIAYVPTRVHVEMHEVCEASDILRAHSGASQGPHYHQSS